MRGEGLGQLVDFCRGIPEPVHVRDVQRQTHLVVRHRLHERLEHFPFVQVGPEVLDGKLHLARAGERGDALQESDRPDGKLRLLDTLRAERHHDDRHFHIRRRFGHLLDPCDTAVITFIFDERHPGAERDDLTPVLAGRGKKLLAVLGRVDAVGCLLALEQLRAGKVPRDHHFQERCRHFLGGGPDGLGPDTGKVRVPDPDPRFSVHRQNRTCQAPANSSHCKHTSHRHDSFLQSCIVVPLLPEPSLDLHQRAHIPHVHSHSLQGTPMLKRHPRPRDTQSGAGLVRYLNPA